MANVDHAAADELRLYIVNDGELYRQQFLPIVENIKRKLKSGKYDHTQAPKLWGYLVESGAKKYNREFGDGTLSLKMFPKATREHVAREMADEILPRIQRGEYGEIVPARKKNPAKRRMSRAPSGRVGLNRKEYVTRPSQAPGHRAPSARLKTRRKAALIAPKGFYPNPIQEKPTESVFIVQKEVSKKWLTIGHFPFMEDAENFARYVAKNTGKRVRVLKKT